MDPSTFSSVAICFLCSRHFHNPTQVVLSLQSRNDGDELPAEDEDALQNTEIQQLLKQAAERVNHFRSQLADERDRAELEAAVAVGGGADTGARGGDGRRIECYSMGGPTN